MEAEAAYLYGYYESRNTGWWENNSVIYEFEDELLNGSFSSYASVWNAAVGSWVEGKVSFAYNQSVITSPDVVLGVDYLADVSMAGIVYITPKTGNPGILAYADAAINLDYPSINQSHVAQSAAAHELGHICGLLDVDVENPVEFVLMNTHRDRTEVYLPTEYDLYGVELFYNAAQ